MFSNNFISLFRKFKCLFRWKPNPSKGEYGFGFPGTLDTVQHNKLPRNAQVNQFYITLFYMTHWISYVILSVYRDPQGWDIVATLSVAMISQSLRVAISLISATKILGFLSFFCDICQYRNKISDFFEHFLRYGKYRKKGQKGAKIFVALMLSSAIMLSIFINQAVMRVIGGSLIRLYTLV